MYAERGLLCGNGRLAVTMSFPEPARARCPRHGSRSPPAPLFILTTAVVTGASVLSIEVLGSRIIGPFFGVSLFVWTALLTVTLLALASGYALGGLLADGCRCGNRLYGIIVLAAVTVLAIPLLKEPVVRLSMDAGLRAGTLIASTLLFGPALFLLGCVSPMLVMLAGRGSPVKGRTVGSLYAISTLGSVAGAVLTGYVLIGHVGVNGILRLCAASLLLLGVVHFLVWRRLTRALLIVLVLAIPSPRQFDEVLFMKDGTKVTLVDSLESAYGNIKIVDYSFGSLTMREMTIDGLVQGGIDTRSGLPVHEYVYLMQYLPVLLHPQGTRALVVGMGAGTIPTWYESRGISTDVVDIDPGVETMARRHFGFSPAGRVFIADARQFFYRQGTTYDYVLLDVFNGDATPRHILSVEGLRQIKSRMAPGGILAINLIGSVRTSTSMTASVVRTIHDVFAQVDLYPAFDPDTGDGTGNLVVVAYDGPHRRVAPGAIPHVVVHPLTSQNIMQRLSTPFMLQDDGTEMLLSDDFNPIDVHDAWLREQVRRQILDSTRWELLLGADRARNPGGSGLPG
jgi:spermidine synthase